jgi:hypothetical protein
MSGSSVVTNLCSAVKKCSEHKAKFMRGTAGYSLLDKKRDER